jgi:hypothetical protein
MSENYSRSNRSNGDTGSSNRIRSSLSSKKGSSIGTADYGSSVSSQRTSLSPRSQPPKQLSLSKLTKKSKRRRGTSSASREKKILKKGSSSSVSTSKSSSKSKSPTNVEDLIAALSEQIQTRDRGIIKFDKNIKYYNKDAKGAVIDIIKSNLKVSEDPHINSVLNSIKNYITSNGDPGSRRDLENLISDYDISLVNKYLNSLEKINTNYKIPKGQRRPSKEDIDLYNKLKKSQIKYINEAKEASKDPTEVKVLEYLTNNHKKIYNYTPGEVNSIKILQDLATNDFTKMKYDYIVYLYTDTRRTIDDLKLTYRTSLKIDKPQIDAFLRTNNKKIENLENKLHIVDIDYNKSIQRFKREHLPETELAYVNQKRDNDLMYIQEESEKRISKIDDYFEKYSKVFSPTVLEKMASQRMLFAGLADASASQSVGASLKRLKF